MTQASEFSKEELNAIVEMGKLTAGEGVEETVVEEGSEPVVETSGLSDFEKEQVAKGWNPKGEKSAGEWARHESLYSEIQHRGKEIKQLKRTIDSMKEFMSKHEKATYERARKDLELSREQALAENNYAAVNNIDQEMRELAEPVQVTEPPEEVVEFLDKHNEWYNGTTVEHKKMRAYANRIDRELSLDLGGADDPATHMQMLEEAILEKFPTYFNKNTVENKPKLQAVESGQSVGIAKKGKMHYTINDLSPEQKKCAHDFERAGIMTRDDFIKTLADAGEL